MLSSLASVSGNFPIWVMQTEIPKRESLLIFIGRGSSRRIISPVCVLTSESNHLLSSCSSQMTCFTRNVRHMQAVSLVASMPCEEPRSLRLIKIAPFVCAAWLQKSLVNYVFNHLWGFPDNSAGKESTCNAGDPGLIPGLGRSLGEGKGYPIQYFGLENSMDCIGASPTPRLWHCRSGRTVVWFPVSSESAFHIEFGRGRVKSVYPECCAKVSHQPLGTPHHTSFNSTVVERTTPAHKSSGSGWVCCTQMSLMVMALNSYCLQFRRLLEGPSGRRQAVGDGRVPFRRWGLSMMDCLRDIKTGISKYFYYQSRINQKILETLHKSEITTPQQNKNIWLSFGEWSINLSNWHVDCRLLSGDLSSPFQLRCPTVPPSCLWNL